jgi:hypothetical protein
VRTLRLGLRAAFTTLVAAFPVGSFAPQLLSAAPSAVQRAAQGVRLVPHGGRCNKKEEGALWLSMAPKKRGAPPKEPCEPSEPEQGAGGAKRSKQVRTWLSARNETSFWRAHRPQLLCTLVTANCASLAAGKARHGQS